MKNLFALIAVVALLSCKKEEQPKAKNPINCSCGKIDSLTSGLGVWRIHVSNDCSGNDITTTLPQNQWQSTNVGDTWCNDGGEW